MRRASSPFADTAPADTQLAAAELKVPRPEAPPIAEQAPAEAAAPVTSTRRPTPLEALEARFPGISTARLPSIATVRAYHKAGEYVPWEAALISWPASVHGWFAVCWATACTCIAWAGAGRYVQRGRTLWQVGIPGLVRAQLPPLRDLAAVPRAWVGFWSAVCWLGLKFWRLPMALVYVAAAVLPFVL